MTGSAQIVGSLTLLYCQISIAFRTVHDSVVLGDGSWPLTGRRGESSTEDSLVSGRLTTHC